MTGVPATNADWISSTWRGSPLAANPDYRQGQETARQPGWVALACLH